MQIIWGEEDAWQSVDWAHRLHAAVPGSELHIVPGAGHFVMEDDAAAVSERLLAFFRDHPLESRSHG